MRASLLSDNFSGFFLAGAFREGGAGALRAEAGVREGKSMGERVADAVGLGEGASSAEVRFETQYGSS